MKRSGFQFGEPPKAPPRGASKKDKGKDKAGSSGLDKFTKPAADGLQRVIDALAFSPPPKTPGGSYKG